jgi:DNA ligase-1
MDDLALLADAIAQTSSRTRKLQLAAAYFRTLDDDDLARAVRFLTAAPIADSETQLSIGRARLREALTRIVPWDADTLSLCFSQVGDSGETIGLLLQGHTRNQPLTLTEAELWFQRLHTARTTAAKVDLLEAAFLSFRPRTLLYFIKVITGNLRIGFLEKMVEEAVAAATGAPHHAIREANNRSGDLARVAIAARRGELDSIGAALFHPMEFMLAKPLEQLPTEGIGEAHNWLVEDKYDGIRAQVHTSHNRVAIYSQGMEDVTLSYPEVVAAMRRIPHSVIVDGELLGWREGRALAFAQLQRRLARKKVSADLLAGVPVVFMAYDLLFANGDLLLDQPVERRRTQLENVFTGAAPPLLLAPQSALANDDLDQRFTAAREQGNEGLILKRRGSLYEAGRRTGAWVKVKRAMATLDVVVTAAEQGTGRRATMLSDFTFGVWDGTRFVNIGKAYSGLTDDELRELTRLFRAQTVERFSRVVLVKPCVVLEVAFDGVQKSPRHKSGYALRFPRIVRWRRDKTPEQADDLARVVALYEESLS